MKSTFFAAPALLLVLAGIAGCPNVVEIGIDAADPGANPTPPPDPLPVDPDLTDRGPRPDSPFAPAAARLRRLLAPQYTNAVKDLLGTAAAAAVVAPPDVPLNGFVAVGAAELSLSASTVDAYEASAAAAAAVASVDPSSPLRAVCIPSAVDDVACFSQIAGRLGRRAFRRTLEADEIQRYAAIGVEAATAYGEVDRGLEYLALVLLQSPNFLYVVEIGDPSQPAEARRLTNDELATRLSFFLTNAPPSDELLDAAEAGSLSSPAALEAEARALLADSRAQETLRHYMVEKLQLAALPTLNRPDPALSVSMRQLMIEETLRTVDDVVWARNADARELLNTRDTFVNDELAGYYGFDLPGSGTFFQKVRTPAGEDRAGLFTQGAFLVRFAHPDRSSPTLRGKFIREALLCTAIDAPPPEVVTTLPEDTDDHLPQTTRDRLASHAGSPACAGCHSSMDPLGFALEHFDQFGRYRSHENGLPIDATAELDGEPADGAGEFMSALDSRSDMLSCLVRGLFRNGVGHIDGVGEEGSLYDVDTAFIGSGMKLQEALVAIAVSDAFGFVSTVEPTTDDAANGGGAP